MIPTVYGPHFSKMPLRRSCRTYLMRRCSTPNPTVGGGIPGIQHRTFSFSCVPRRSASGKTTPPDFGFLFDIDGVIVRGKRILPFAPKAFENLVDKDGNFRIPTVFVTNAGNRMRQEKADQLSNWLNVPVSTRTYESSSL